MKPLTKEDRIKWRQFLASETGMKGISWLEQMKSEVHEDPEAHNVILRAGIMQGYNKLLNQVRDLSVIEDVAQSDESQPELANTRTR